MKRVAERQRTKDDLDDDIEATPGTGLHKANDAALSMRPMKGIPKRGMGMGSATTNPTTTSSIVNGFTPSPGGFSAFGNATTSLQASTPTSTSPRLKYYQDLRGLNFDLTDFLSRAFAIDPFSDVSVVLKEYASHLRAIKASLDNAEPKPPVLPPSMPQPPSKFTGFGGLTASPSANGTGASAFSVPSTTSASSSFVFGGSPPTSSTSSNPFALPKPSDARFNSFSKPTPAEPVHAASPPSFFGNMSNSSSSPSVFGGESSKPASSSPFTFGTSAASKPSTPLPFSFGTPATAPSSSSTVGVTVDSSPPKAPAAGFSAFGGLISKPPSSGGTTGSGSIGNPLGFGFGNPSEQNSLALAKPAEGSALTSDVGEGSDSLVPTTDVSRDATPNLMGGPNPHDAEGEGEEDEEIVHQVKSKVLVLSSSGDKSWNELGTGFLRIKRHKENGTCRLLLRNSSNGKINVNFRFYKSMKPVLKPKSVLLVGHEDGKEKTFLFRVANPDSASTLKTQIEAQVPA